MPNVVFLPGLLGSQLADVNTPSGLPTVYWIGAGLLGNLGMSPLQLAADGFAPGPLAQGRMLSADDPLPGCYRSFTLFMESLGWNVLSLGYDWRHALNLSAQAVMFAALARFKSEPFWLIAHSQGGLVARLVWKLMQNQGRGWQVAGIVTIGTPHYGSWEIVRLWGRLPLLYAGLAAACGVYHGADPRDALAWIDAIVTTWPGAYQLMPCPWAGPLPAASPILAQQLYNRLFYLPGNAYVSSPLLQGAQYSWQALQQAIPPGNLTQIVGTGHRTPYMLTGTDNIADPESYLYTDDGDAQVAGLYARLPGVPTVNVLGDHGTLCLNPAVWAATVRTVIGPA